MPQEPYGDSGSLIRSVHADLARAAYGLLGHYADAEDAVQNGCFKLLSAWHRVGRLETAEKQGAYLMRMVLNEALQILRSPYRRWEDLGTADGGYGYAAERAGTRPAFEDEIQARQDLRLVWKAISGLPAMRRDVILLRAAGWEYQDIATRLGVEVSTVRSHISEARKQLSRTVPRDWEGSHQ